jgi:hypothetical protein
MNKKLFGLLLGVFVIWGSTIAFSQCGDHIKQTFQTCGGHCGSVVRLTCEGVGSNCQDDTGDLGFGCCGLMLFEPGGCGFAGVTRPRELPPSVEFAAFKEALVLRKKPTLTGTNLPAIASCGDNKNAFNQWLEAKLKQRQVSR